MAQILLHGTLHATIFEAESLSNPHRASGSAPKFIRKVSTPRISPSSRQASLILITHYKHDAIALIHTNFLHC
jgi:hypothetical protein